LTDRNIWPVIIPITGAAGTTYNFLTFDREQVTGTYSYGNIHWYRAAEVATDFYEYDPALTDPSVLTNMKINRDKQCRIFPNPAQNTLNIEGLADPITATIRNASGQVILEKGTTGTLEISNLKPGIYFLNIGTDKAMNFIKTDL
jgi:Ca2+-binding RTX toxin-like protein